MEKGVPWRSLSNLLAITIILNGCARAAPELPDAQRLDAMSRSSTYANSNCPQILQKISDLESEKRQMEYIIQSNRGRNQAAGYFAGLFIVPIVAVDNNSIEKARLDEIQIQLDELRAVGNIKFCFF